MFTFQCNFRKYIHFHDVRLGVCNTYSDKVCVRYSVYVRTTSVWSLLMPVPQTMWLAGREVAIVTWWWFHSTKVTVAMVIVTVGVPQTQWLNGVAVAIVTIVLATPRIAVVVVTTSISPSRFPRLWMGTSTRPVVCPVSAASHTALVNLLNDNCTILSLFHFSTSFKSQTAMTCSLFTDLLFF